MTFIPELIIPRHERILSSPKLDNSFEIVNARDESRVTTPLLSFSPPLPPPSPSPPADTMKLNAAASRIYLDVSVLPSEQSRADDDDDDADEEENDDSTRKKNGEGIGYAVIDTRDHRTLRGRKRCATSSPRPPLLRPLLDELAALSWNRWTPLSPLFPHRIHVCRIPPRTWRDTNSFVQRFAIHSAVGQFQGDDLFQANERSLKFSFGWKD